MRDSQRQKLYNAEGHWKRERDGEWIMKKGSKDKSEIEALYEMLAEAFGTTKPPVVINTRLKLWAGTAYHDHIEFCDGVTLYTALHEFAHWMPGSHKHDWKFVSNLLEVVQWWYGDEEARAMRDSFRKYEVIWHLEDSEQKRIKAQAAQERRRERHGETGTVYLLVRVVADGYLYRCHGNYYSDYLRNASVWRRKATAMKKGCTPGNLGYAIWEAEGVYDAYENKWTAQSLVDQVEGALVPA